MTDKSITQGLDGHLDHAQEEWLRLMPDGWDGRDYAAENASTGWCETMQCARLDRKKLVDIPTINVV